MESLENAGIIRELEQWKKQSIVYEKLFSSETLGSSARKVEQIRNLMSIAARYRSTDNAMAMRLIRNERRLLERSAFPSLAARVLFRISNLIFERRVNEESRKLIQENSSAIQSSLSYAGFPELVDSISKGMNSALGLVAKSVSFQVKGDDRMSVSVEAIRQEKGTYDLSYTSTLSGGEYGSRSLHFGPELSKFFSANNAEALLRGKAVRIENGEWLQLDFTDRDKKGNFLIKRYPESYGFNIRQELEKLPLKDKALQDAIIRRLEKGQNVTVQLGEGKAEKVITLLANPGGMNFELKDLSGKKVELASLFTKAPERQGTARYVKEKTSRKWIRQQG
ncbi:hypothetical protein ABIE26_002940 [Pedobacter africanus]|uniref:hypothetical protein n=1 Tax=Pedobacter africanus TaxID=151894 RepID=UPI0033958EE6